LDLRQQAGVVRRFWDALPIDGSGFVGPADPDARRLIAIATHRRLRMVPRGLRPVVVAAARLLWCVKAASTVHRAACRFGFGAGESLRQYRDACLFGLRPKDAFAWRRTTALRRPLSTQAFWIIQSTIGDPTQRARLDDKLATAAAIKPFPVQMPRQLAVIAAGTVAPVLPDATRIFVKPRSGRRSQNAFSIVRLDTGAYRVDGARRDEAYVAARLRNAAANDDLLVQQCLSGVSEIADLGTADGAPPVIRIMTAREPDGQPFAHSGWMTIRVPGEASGHPLRDALRMPIAIETGSLLAGYWLGAPRLRFDRSPWHQAPIAGRVLPGFREAADAAVTAAQAFPGVPIIGWDVILTDDGPVVLEGNSGTDLLVVTWAAEGAPDAVPLMQLLLQWATVQGATVS
jgi:hypothetical protein